jgi:predicted ester cyclase
LESRDHRRTRCIGYASSIFPACAASRTRGRTELHHGFREAFPDLNFWGAGDLIAEGDYVVGRWEGGGTHTGPASALFLAGSLPAASGRKMRFTGTTVLRVEHSKIGEEVGLDDGVTALQQLGILKAV